MALVLKNKTEIERRRFQRSSISEKIKEKQREEGREDRETEEGAPLRGAPDEKMSEGEKHVEEP